MNWIINWTENFATGAKELRMTMDTHTYLPTCTYVTADRDISCSCSSGHWLLGAWQPVARCASSFIESSRCVCVCVCVRVCDVTLTSCFDIVFRSWCRTSTNMSSSRKRAVSAFLSLTFRDVFSWNKFIFCSRSFRVSARPLSGTHFLTAFISVNL